MTVDPLMVDGDEREDAAAAVGSDIADVCQACELGLLSTLTTAVTTALPSGAVMAGSLARFRRQIAALGAARF
jgi:hypothetical protein